MRTKMSDFAIRFAVIDAASVTHRLVRNPNYSGHLCAVPNCRVVPVVERAMKPKFFEALKKDVAENEFRNPILVYNTPEFGLLLAFGGSRLRVAKQLRIGIPAIVVDYAVKYTWAPRVTPDNWQSFFTDVPEQFEFTDIGIDTHYSIERNRRETFDPAGIVWFPEDEDFVAEEFPWLNDADLKHGCKVRK